MYLIPETFLGHDCGFQICYGIREAAKVLKVTTNAIESRIRRGTIDYVKINDKNHIPEKAIELLKGGHLVYSFVISCDYYNITTQNVSAVGHIIKFLATFFGQTAKVEFKRSKLPVAKRKKAERCDQVFEVLDRQGLKVFAHLRPKIDPTLELMEKDGPVEPKNRDRRQAQYEQDARFTRIVYLLDETTRNIKQSQAWMTEERFIEMKKLFLCNPAKAWSKFFSKCEFLPPQIELTKDEKKENVIQDGKACIKTTTNFNFHWPSPKYLLIE